MFIAMRLSKPEFAIAGAQDIDTKTVYPGGAIGCLWVFDTIEDLQAHYGPDTEWSEITEGEPDDEA